MGFGKGKAVGLEGTTILLKIDFKNDKYLDLSNQRGFAPADALNVKQKLTSGEDDFIRIQSYDR